MNEKLRQNPKYPFWDDAEIKCDSLIILCQIIVDDVAIPRILFW